MSVTMYIILSLIILLLVSGLFIVKQQTAAIIERFGRFVAIRQSGLHFKIPVIDRIAGRLSLRILQLDVIVETKNRTKRLFHRIPNYEKVQLEAYMFLTEMDKAIHIECYNDEQNKTDYNHDAEFWEDRVAKIIAYVEENIAPLILSLIHI